MAAGRRKRRSARRAARAPARRPELSGVLQLIWREEEISRAEIARRQELSPSTVSPIVDELLGLGLVKEAGAGGSRGGRRPLLLRFDDDAATILGVDLDTAHVAVTLTNLRGSVLAWEKEMHPVGDDPPGALALATRLAERCLESWGGRRRLLLGIGMAVPSPIDRARPGFLDDLVMPGWKGVDVSEGLRRRFKVPVLIDNDANLGALAERWWGAGRDVDDFAYVKLATGIGAGFFVDGRIYRGASGTAGEVGHLAMDPDGAPCSCGLRGCLVTLIGAPAILRRARELLRDHPGSELAGRDFGISNLEDAALAGDPLALQVVREVAHHLGVGLAGLVNLLNPAVVILGGGLARLGELLLGPLRHTVERRTLASSVAVARIVTSQLGDRSVAVGAATLVLQRALSDPRQIPGAQARR
jgi:glucokinase-like ROK family protein